MNRQEMNLNIRYDAGSDVWDKIPGIYSRLDGWLGAEEAPGVPHWFSCDESEKHVLASVEPGGLHFTALMADDEWEAWKKKAKDIATEALGYTVGEVELGEVDA